MGNILKSKNIQTNNFNPNWLWLLFLIVLVNACGLFVPVLGSNDAYFYALISKTMVNNHDWINLYYDGHDWLDKPHFPFWITAISFKIFGFSAFAYALPGFLFSLLGAVYTYRLTRLFFNLNSALIAAISYLTAIHLLLSSIDVRAEAFLLGQIMPACFYLWRYNAENRVKHLILTAFFTGLALMTKGLFVLVTIFSGQIIYLIYTKQYRKLCLQQWLPILLSFFFALPEFVCLYLQFDLHPEKVVFDTTGVSGLKWFFWGSQFGRFFNSGPIVNQHGNPLFFVHTFLWAFLPWSLLFIMVTGVTVRKFNNYSSNERAKIVYLLAAFLPTFIMFSATKFQLDHYTNIIIPFAAILIAWFIDKTDSKYLGVIQLWLAILLLLLNLVIIIVFFSLSWLLLLAIVPLFLLWIIKKRYSKFLLDSRIVIIPSLAVCSIFLLLMLINGVVYKKNDAGYNIAKIIPDNSVVYLLDTDKLTNTLGFHADVVTISVNESSEVNIAKYKQPVYLVINQSKIAQVQNMTNLRLIGNFSNIPQERIVQALLSSKKQQQLTQYFSVYKLN